MSKCYSKILEEKDIKSALEFMIPRVHTYQMAELLRMIIKELKKKGIIEKDWLENHFGIESVGEE